MVIVLLFLYLLHLTEILARVFLLELTVFLLLEVIVAKTSFRHRLESVLLSLILILLILLLLLLILRGSKISKLGLLIWSCSTNYLSWVVDLIVVLVVFMALNSRVWLPTPRFSLVQVCLTSWG